MSGSNRYTQKIEIFSAPLGRWLVTYRRLVLLVFVALSLWLGLQCAGLGLDPGFGKSIPASHPYTEVYKRFAAVFGGANTIEIAMVRKQGEMFDPGFLQKLKELTDDVRNLPGIDPAGVLSLFSPQAVFVTVDEQGFKGGRIVPSDYQGSPNEVLGVRANVLLSNEVGRLVSRDLSGALVRGELLESRLDQELYKKIGVALEELRAKYEDENTTIHIIGFAKFISDIMFGARFVLLFFAVSLVVTGMLLFWFLKSIRLALITLGIALLSVVWELGIVKMLGLGIDPLSVLVPFLIFSIATSHAVQMVNTWSQLILAGGNPVDAAEGAFRRLFVPGTTALLGNAVGFAVIMLIDIPIIRELGVVASIGVAVMILTNKALLPVILSYTTPPKSVSIDQKRGNGSDKRMWSVLSLCANRRHALPILISGVAMLAAAEAGRRHLIIGDVEAGAPELRADARYNLDIAAITKQFQIGTDELLLVATGGEENCTRFSSIYQIDRVQEHIASLPGVQGVSSLAGVVRSRYVGNSEGHPKFFEVPRNPYTIGATLRGLELGQRLFNEDCSALPIRVYLKDHKARTLDQVIKSAKEYSTSMSEAPMSVSFAAGSAGVMAAINEAVSDAQGKMLIALYLGVGSLCLLTFLSFRATFCVLIPLIVVSQFAEAVMTWMGIGLKVSTLPVVALGAGVGVDYGIYLFSRLQSGLRQGLGLQVAYLKALNEVGAAVMFTAITMSIGVACWIFSPLKFQADMGLLLTYMFFVNMVVALVLVPALAAILLRRGSCNDPAISCGGIPSRGNTR
jgi:predicted RND superfamily exporter protein